MLPPSLWNDPDWYESIIAIVVVIISISGGLIKAFIVNPLQQSTNSMKKQLDKIDKSVYAVSDEVKLIRIAMEAVSSSAHSAHHRIDSLEERVTRTEGLFMKREE